MSDPAAATSSVRLSSEPDWGYLLREFYEHYRAIRSGGSAPIRGHQRIVRDRISAVIRDDSEIADQDPATLPVTRHLGRALDQGKQAPSAPFIRAIAAVAGRLVWRYGYDRMPKGLADKYGYAEFAGPNGPVLTDRIILGLVLFAPRCVYPAHAHDGITESYVCLSGAMSENDHGVFAPGSLIYNPPGHTHRITVSDREPCLLAYAWTGDPDILTGQKMTFSRGRTGTAR